MSTLGYTVKQMHIEVIAQLQRQGSYRRDKLFNQQIDWRLRTAEERVIKSKIKPDPRFPNRFEIDQKSVSDIQSIITSNLKLNVIKETDVRGYALLPNNFSYLVNDRSNVVEECDGEAFTSSTENILTQLRVWELGASQKITPNYYTSVSVSLGSATHSKTTSGFPSKTDKDEIIPIVIDLFRLHGIQVYWERYNDVYRHNSFIAIITDPTVTTTLRVDETTIEEKERINKTVTRYKDVTTREYGNRCVIQSYLSDILDSSYMKPSPDSPVTVLSDGRLYVHTTKKFLVSTISIDYIRKPRPISLTLGISSELAGSVHQEICDIAVELLKRDIEAGDYSAKIQDNLVRSKDN